MAVATPTLLGSADTVEPGSYLDLLYKVLLDIDDQLRCRNQLASVWTPVTTIVPLGAPGIPGMMLAPADPTRLGLIITNTDPTNNLYLGSNSGVGYPGGANGNYLEIFPQQSYSWNLNDADRNLARYGLAGPGGPIVVCVTTVH